MVGVAHRARASDRGTAADGCAGRPSAIAIAGLDLLVQRNVLAMSGRAVETAGE